MLTEILVIIGGLLLSMTIHEATHAFTSNWLGDDTAMLHGRLTLNPLKHIDWFATILLPLMLVFLGLPPFAAAKPVPFNPNRVRGGEFGAALVGISGPFSNLLIAAALGFWTRYFIGFDGGVVTELVSTLVVLNLSLFVFNMIPWPPLDGSRLLYAFAPDGIRRVMMQIESLGLVGITVFIFLLFPLFSSTITKAVEVMFEFITGTNLIF